jgi:hypothetical protein
VRYIGLAMAMPTAANPASLQSALWASPVSWIVLSAACVGLDRLSGPTIQFPIVYLLPVSLAAWHGSRRWGIALAVLLPLCRLAFRAVWEPPWTVTESAINAGIRIAVFVTFAWLIDRTARQMHDLRRAQLMEGLLGVCTVCRRIRNERAGTWQRLEAYVATRPADLRREVCPDCRQESQQLLDRR